MANRLAIETRFLRLVRLFFDTPQNTAYRTIVFPFSSNRKISECSFLPGDCNDGTHPIFLRNRFRKRRFL